MVRGCRAGKLGAHSYGIDIWDHFIGQYKQWMTEAQYRCKSRRMYDRLYDYVVDKKAYVFPWTESLC